MERWIFLAAIGLLAAACGYSATSRASGWKVVETENVRLRTNAPVRQAVELAAELQRMRDAFTAALLPCARPPADARVEVSAPALEELRAMEAAEPAEYRSWRLPWVEEYGGVIVLAEGDGRTGNAGFQHELVHHMLGGCLGSAPDWLVEGLAMLLQTAELRGDRLVVGRAGHVLRRPRAGSPASVYTRTGETGPTFHPLPTIERLITTDGAALYSRGEGAAHRRTTSSAAAWALVRLLHLGPASLRPRFRRFVQRLVPLGVDPVTAFREAFDGEDLQAMLDDSLDVPRFDRREIRVALPERARPRVREMRAAEVHLHWAWLWLTSTAVPDAQARARDHLRQALRDPATRHRAQLLDASLVLVEHGAAAGERAVLAALRERPRDDELLHARLDLLLLRGADPAAIAAAGEALRPVARTADQLCTLARVDLARGDLASARSLAARGRALRPSSWHCRRVSHALRGEPSA